MLGLLDPADHTQSILRGGEKRLHEGGEGMSPSWRPIPEEGPELDYPILGEAAHIRVRAQACPRIRKGHRSLPPCSAVSQAFPGSLPTGPMLCDQEAGAGAGGTESSRPTEASGKL